MNVRKAKLRKILEELQYDALMVDNNTDPVMSDILNESITQITALFEQEMGARIREARIDELKTVHIDFRDYNSQIIQHMLTDRLKSLQEADQAKAALIGWRDTQVAEAVRVSCIEELERLKMNECYRGISADYPKYCIPSEYVVNRISQLSTSVEKDQPEANKEPTNHDHQQ